MCGHDGSRKAKTRSFGETTRHVTNMADLATKANFTAHHQVAWCRLVGDCRDKRNAQTQVAAGFAQAHTTNDRCKHFMLRKTDARSAFEPSGRCVVLLRREGGTSRLGLADPPYTAWAWKDLDTRFNGPALLRLPDGRGHDSGNRSGRHTSRIPGNRDGSSGQGAT